MARYHRKGTPGAGRRWRRWRARATTSRVARCAALLRLAEQLERARDQLVREAHVDARRRRASSCGSRATATSSLARWAAERQARPVRAHLREAADGPAVQRRRTSATRRTRLGNALRRILAVACCATALLAVPGAARAADAPGAPGSVATWTEGDKDGIGQRDGPDEPPAAHARRRRDDRGLRARPRDAQHPRPAARGLRRQVVLRARARGRDPPDRARRPAQPHLPAGQHGEARVAGGSPKTYVTDPARDAVLVDVQFESLTGGALELYAILDPACRTRATTTARATAGRHARRVRRAATRARSPPSPAPSRVSSGYHGASDGWTDLRSDHRMDWTYDTASAAGQRRPDRAAAR